MVIDNQKEKRGERLSVTTSRRRRTENGERRTEKGWFADRVGRIVTPNPDRDSSASRLLSFVVPRRSPTIYATALTPRPISEREQMIPFRLLRHFRGLKLEIKDPAILQDFHFLPPPPSYVRSSRPFTSRPY